MKPYDIIDFIESIAPLSFAAPWDASGVQVACSRDQVSHLTVLLDPTLENLERAVAGGAEFILAHHPLAMKPRFPNRCDEYQAVLALLLKNDVWLYSAHTPLDANPQGPARWLAESLKLTRVSTLEPLPPGEGGYTPYHSEVNGHGGMPGIGFTGTLNKPVAYTEFCRELAAALGRGEWLGCGRRPEAVFRVACCPGSGGSLLNAAVAAGADVYITGDFKYHQALEALSAGMRVMDVGHFILEEEMMRRFARQLERNLEIPVSFLPSRDPFAVELAPQSI